MNPPRKVIITGSPGAGKTTIIETLRSSGYLCYHEIAREVIREHMESGTSILPWTDLGKFSQIVFAGIVEQVTAHRNGLAFFDRGAPDVLAYLKYGNLPVPGETSREEILSLGYDRRIFITPPWPEIFSRDEERRESFEESLVIYGHLCETYSSLGFEVLEIPKLPVTGRISFILQNLGPDSIPSLNF
jgi:predicted ATPase